MSNPRFWHSWKGTLAVILFALLAVSIAVGVLALPGRSGSGGGYDPHPVPDTISLTRP